MRLVYLALGWTTGLILAATYSTLIPLYWLISLGVAVLVAGIGWETRWRWLWLALVALALGGYRYQFVPATSDLAQYNLAGGATVQGLVIAEPDRRDDRVLLRVRVESLNLGSTTIETSGVVLVTAPPIATTQYGDTVRVTGNLGIPAEYDTFSYADFLSRQGVFSVMSNTVVETLEPDRGNPVRRVILDWNHALQGKIATALPDPQAGLLIGILLGNERGIDPKLNDDFTRVGASHIIAISGFNMALIAGLVMGGMDRYVRRQRLGVVLGIAVLAIYTLLVGANAAVVRAAIMSSVPVVGRLFKRKAYVPASLAFVALIMSVHQPTVLWDISFQLSFFAVLGLALFADPLTQRFERGVRRFFPRHIANILLALLNEPLVVSIAVLITTLPLTLFYFQRLSIVTLLVNILIVPVQSYILYFGGIALIFSTASFLWPVAQVLFWITLIFLSWSIEVVRIFGDLSYADVIVGVNETFVWVVFLSIIGGAILKATRPLWALRFSAMIRRRNVLTATLCMGLGIAVLMVAIFRSRPDGNLHVWWLDVGHSNAVLLQTPGGAQVLVDGGRFPSRLLTAIGDRLPFYDRTLEVVFITHPDEFDTGALPAVLKRYDASVILTNGQPNLSQAFAVLEEAIAPYRVVQVYAGYSVEVDDGTRIEVLHPQQTPALSDSMGDGAMVLRVTYGDISFLLTSDVSIEGQRDLLAGGQWPLASVMQLPQHGTQRSLSSDFLEAAQPQVIVVQSDIANRRGDPSSEILSLVEDTAVWRTDESGALHFWTDGSALWAIEEG